MLGVGLMLGTGIDRAIADLTSACSSGGNSETRSGLCAPAPAGIPTFLV
jgi:hypothetical protein